MKYRKKPVVIEAHRWDGDWDALNAWLDSLGFQDGDDPAMWVDDTDDTLLWIATLEGNLRTPLGWVVIIGVQREAYSCKPDIFEATYEPVADTTELSTTPAMIHEVAEAIRHHATAPSELIYPHVQIDALIAWVADWIENPPDWVKVSWHSAAERKS